MNTTKFDEFVAKFEELMARAVKLKAAPYNWHYHTGVDGEVIMVTFSGRGDMTFTHRVPYQRRKHFIFMETGVHTTTLTTTGLPPEYRHYIMDRLRNINLNIEKVS